MPAEFERHTATWMAWPKRREIWGDCLSEVKEYYARLAHIIARFEPLKMMTHAADAEEAQGLCGSSVPIVVLPIDDSWARVTGQWSTAA